MKIAYLGPEASFSHIAAENLFGEDSPRFVPAETIEDVFAFVQSDKAQNGIVPIENSSAGSVVKTMDAFSADKELTINKEYFQEINFQFLSNAKKENIEVIYANPMALSQCEKWLKANYPNVKIEQVVSNSLAAIKASENINSAAVSTEAAASLYNVKILEKNIQDYQNNVTRFLVIGKKSTESTGNDKTSLLFSLKHEPGSLYKSLGAIAERNINMTRIESRIMKMGNWEYYFFVDIEGHIEDKNISEAIDDMRTNCSSLRILGSYPRGDAPWS